MAAKILHAKMRIRRKEKEGKRHRRMNQRYLEASIGAMTGIFGTLCEDQVQQAPSDEPTVHILVAPDECQKRRREDKCAG
jgi:hypothetical protein